MARLYGWEVEDTQLTRTFIRFPRVRTRLMAERHVIVLLAGCTAEAIMMKEPFRRCLIVSGGWTHHSQTSDLARIKQLAHKWDISPERLEELQRMCNQILRRYKSYYELIVKANMERLRS